MSTASIIARPTADGGWEGRYCHWDGYPTHQARVLLELVVGAGGDVDRTRRYLIDEHTGWSRLGGDWNQPTGYLTPGTTPRAEADPDGYERYLRRNQCSCHGDLPETGPMVRSIDAPGVSWVYVLDDEALRALRTSLRGNQWIPVEVGRIPWGTDVDVATLLEIQRRVPDRIPAGVDQRRAASPVVADQRPGDTNPKQRPSATRQEVAVRETTSEPVDPHRETDVSTQDREDPPSLHSPLTQLASSPRTMDKETTRNRSGAEQAFAGPSTIHGLAAGTLVVCRYRMPSPRQPWLHEIHVGQVELPGTDPAAWNGHNSEADYCDATGTVPVNYGRFRAHEDPSDLIPITPEQALLPHEDKVALFLGAEARARLDRSLGRPGDLEIDLGIDP